MKNIKTPFFIYLLVIFSYLAGMVFPVIALTSNESDSEFYDKYYSSIIPSDTFFEKQWYLKKIKAPEAWNEIRESESMTVAIIDSGVAINHPDLKDVIWKNVREINNNNIDDDRNGFIDDFNGWDFVDNVADPNPKFKEGYNKDGIMHGTIVAGVLGALGNNASGITGVSWRLQIMPLRVLNEKGEGNTKSVVRAIDYAIQNGADVINLSFVGSNYNSSLSEAIKRAYNAGIIVVAAAGNDAGNSYFLDRDPLYPVCYDGKNGENMVIGVAATDALDQKTIFSGYGRKCIDISAPGVSIYSTAVYSPEKNNAQDSFSEYYDGFWSGTSMAVPMVSATVALVEAANPRLNRDEVIEIIKNSADNINKLNPEYVDHLGSGRLNVYNAILKAREKFYETEINLVVAPFSKRESEVKITDNKGKEKYKFNAISDNFRGGVNVAVGDVDGDGSEEIVTGAGFTGGPQIKIFNKNGEVKGQFFAYDKNFRGGVNVAVGDVDGDGSEEIVTGAGFTGGPQVRIFKKNGKLQGQFFAYDKNFRGGVNVAVASLNEKIRNSKSKIIAAPGLGGGPQIRIFDDNAKLYGQFFAYHQKFKGGVKVSAGDLDYDGRQEIVTAAGIGGAPHVRVFDDNGILVSSFYSYEENFDGGVNVSVIELNK